jgi:hypothetical protein
MRKELTIGFGLVAVVLAIVGPPIVAFGVLPHEPSLRIGMDRSEAHAVMGNSPDPMKNGTPVEDYDFDSIGKRLDGTSIQSQAPLDPADKAARSHFPTDAKYWDSIGVFRLKGQDRERVIALYFLDSDSELFEFPGATWPNFFSIHAVYEAQPGNWVHNVAYSRARVGFRKVLKIEPTAVVLELLPKCMLYTSSPDEMKRAMEINKPLQVSFSFENGILVAK